MMFNEFLEHIIGCFRCLQFQLHIGNRKQSCND